MTTSRRTTSEPTTLDQSRAALADVERQIGILNAQHLAASQDLGDALAASRLGNKRAEGDAGKYSMRRAGIEAERDRLRLEAASLKARIETMESGEHDRLRDAALADLDRIAAEVIHVQDELAEQIIVAGETGRRLDQLRRDWSRARADAGRLGGDVTAHPKAPAPAAALFQPGVLANPAREVALWRNHHIEPTPIPPRDLTAREHEQHLERQAVAAQRDASSDGPFTIMERIHAKIDQKIGA